MTMVRTYTRKYSNNRNGKSHLPYQSYSLEHLQEAINKVKDGRMSLTDAANTYGVPKSTLSRKTRNINCTQEKAGHPTLFSTAEERIFLKFILLLGAWGFPFEISDLRVFAQKYLNKMGKKVYGLEDNMPGIDWARNFLKRYCSEISNRKSANISTDRARFTSDDIDAFFENYIKTVDGVAADCIINYDETNLTDDPGNKKYIYKRGCKYPERIINTSKTAISLMFSGTASGHLLPIYVVYKSENLWDTWMEAGPEGTRYNRSKSGWFDSVCFEDWFQSIIVPYVRNKSGRKVLIGDNLSSHFSESVLRTCEELNISFVCLPPKTTHLLQPLDVAFFAPLKAYWRDILTRWKLTEGRKHKTLIKSAFPKLLCKLKDKLVEKDAESHNLRAGFNKSGLYPVDPNRPKSRLPQSQTNRSEAEIESISTSVITDILMDLRCPKVPEGTRRKKRFVVDPGKSVSAEDLVKIQSKKVARSKPPEKKNTSSNSTSNIVPDPYMNQIPGSSGLCNIMIETQNYDSDISEERNAAMPVCQIKTKKPYKGKGKGIGKKSKPQSLVNTKKLRENLTIKCAKKKKRIRKSKDSSTSVSDCDIMSTHSDSDLVGECDSDATIEADDFYSVSESILKANTTKYSSGDVTYLCIANEDTNFDQNDGNLVKTDKIYSTGDKTDIDNVVKNSDISNAMEKINLDQNSRILVKSNNTYFTGDKTDLDNATEKTDLSNVIEENDLNQNGRNISEITNTTEDYELDHEYGLFLNQDPSYSVHDFVLVRYLIRKTWTYYVGVIQEINKEIIPKYTVVFFKTVKKPTLAFRKTRIIDRDIIDDLSIVKLISLKESPNNPNELHLAEESDMVYFE